MPKREDSVSLPGRLPSFWEHHAECHRLQGRVERFSTAVMRRPASPHAPAIERPVSGIDADEPSVEGAHHHSALYRVQENHFLSIFYTSRRPTMTSCLFIISTTNAGMLGQSAITTPAPASGSTMKRSASLVSTTTSQARCRTTSSDHHSAAGDPAWLGRFLGPGL